MKHIFENEIIAKMRHATDRPNGKDGVFRYPRSFVKGAHQKSFQPIFGNNTHRGLDVRFDFQLCNVKAG